MLGRGEPSLSIMKIVTWNIRGLNAPNKQRIIKRNLKIINADIILLQETKLNKDVGKKFNNKMGALNYVWIESIELLVV